MVGIVIIRFMICPENSQATCKESYMNTKLVIGVIALLLMVIFVFQNMEVVSVDFLFWSLQASRVVIYIAIFLIGMFIGWVGKTLHRKK